MVIRSLQLVWSTVLAIAPMNSIVLWWDFCYPRAMLAVGTSPGQLHRVLANFRAASRHCIPGKSAQIARNAFCLRLADR